MFSLRISNLDSRCGAFCFRLYLAVRTHSGEHVDFRLCWESDAGCWACNCVAHRTWPAWRCHYVVSFTLRPLDHMAVLDAVTTETNCCRCFQSDRQLCCDAQTCELCVEETTHQIVRSSGQDTPQLVDPRFEKCVRCSSPAEAWMSWKCTLHLRNTKQSVNSGCSEHVHTLCGRNAGGTYSYRCTLRVGDCCYEKRPWQFCSWRFSPSSACPVERRSDVQRPSTCVLAYSYVWPAGEMSASRQQINTETWLLQVESCCLQLGRSGVLSAVDSIDVGGSAGTRPLQTTCNSI